MALPIPPGYRTLRRGRWSEPGRVYLLTIVTAQRARLFLEWEPAATAASVMSDPCNWPNGRLLCWVLMPDHWHGLVELTDGADLAAMVRVAKGRSARAVNQLLGRTGSLWMPGFHDLALRFEENILDAARYVVANPLRAGLVKRIGDYPFWDAIWVS